MRILPVLLLCLILSAPAFAQDDMPQDDQAQLPETVVVPNDEQPVEQLNNDTAQSTEQTGEPTNNTIVVAPPKTPVPVPANAVAAPPPSFETKKYAVLQTLDKLTARTKTVTITVGAPAAVGPIFIDVKSCQKTPPSELPESAAFLQVWEAKPKSRKKNAKDDAAGESQWVFSGWMFASSPALSAMNHPVYDVWVKDCTNDVATSKQK